MQLESFVGARLRCFTVGALEDLNVTWHGVLVISRNPFSGLFVIGFVRDRI